MEAILEENGSLKVNKSEPVVTPPPQDEETEMPDMEQVLHRFLNVPVSEPVLSSSPEPEITENLPSLSGTVPEDVVDSVMPTIRHINLTELKPSALMIVHVSLGSSPQVYRSIVDSGAEVNLISEEKVCELQLKTNPSEIRLKGLGESSQVTLGEVTVTVKLHGRQFPPTVFHVVPTGTISEPVILGYDFLKKNGVMVDCSRNCFSVPGPGKGAFWELYTATNGQPCHQVFYGLNVFSIKSTRLTDQEPTCIPVKVNFPEGQDPTYLCPDCSPENPVEIFYDGMVLNNGLSSKVMGVPGIMSLEEPYSVLVKGFDKNPIKINKGEVIGKAYSLLSLEPPPSCFVVKKEDMDSPSSSLKDLQEVIIKLPISDDLEPSQRVAFHKMLLSHQPVISTGDEDVGECVSTPIRIKLYDETPIYQRIRRFSPPITDAIELQCKELHDLDIIEPSISPWSSPIVPVIKPDKSIRLCVNYRKLNKITVPDRFPMPNLVDSVFGLHGIKYFPCLDLVRGYYQLSLAEESKELTAFSTAFGHWQFKRLSFGLKNAPAVFQREMQRDSQSVKLLSISTIF